MGSTFDPNRHEAVIQEQTSEYPDMTVTKEFQKGYTLRDRLLRPAMVGVARNAKMTDDDIIANGLRYRLMVSEKGPELQIRLFKPKTAMRIQGNSKEAIK